MEIHVSATDIGTLTSRASLLPARGGCNRRARLVTTVSVVRPGTWWSTYDSFVMRPHRWRPSVATGLPRVGNRIYLVFCRREAMRRRCMRAAPVGWPGIPGCRSAMLTLHFGHRPLNAHAPSPIRSVAEKGPARSLSPPHAQSHPIRVLMAADLPFSRWDSIAKILCATFKKENRAISVNIPQDAISLLSTASVQRIEAAAPLLSSILGCGQSPGPEPAEKAVGPAPEKIARGAEKRAGAFPALTRS